MCQHLHELVHSPYEVLGLHSKVMGNSSTATRTRQGRTGRHSCWEERVNEILLDVVLGQRRGQNLYNNFNTQ